MNKSIKEGLHNYNNKVTLRELRHLQSKSINQSKSLKN